LVTFDEAAFVRARALDNLKRGERMVINLETKAVVRRAAIARLGDDGNLIVEEVPTRLARLRPRMKRKA
jgi:hypothetical protein